MTPRSCILLSSGEPAGIGPDLCLQIAALEWQTHLVAVADHDLLAQRATQLGLDVDLKVISDLDQAGPHTAGVLQVYNVPLRVPVTAGQLNTANSAYVLEVLNFCASACSHSQASAMVTGPLHKGVIIDSGVAFTGHTEYLAQRTGASLPVMLLCCETMRVALATTHLPLADVSKALTIDSLCATLRVLASDLSTRFKIDQPVIGVCGLNPHAGEGGHLGTEEIETIEPALATLRLEGMKLLGPLPADTIFTPRILEQVDAVLAMFHDQGLPVLKFAGFGTAVNVTLGLPIVRTSVDHGTALDLAATGQADDGSMRAALQLALDLTGV